MEALIVREVISKKPNQENFKKWEIVEMIISNVFDLFLLSF